VNVRRAMRHRVGTLVGTLCLVVTFGMGYALGWHSHATHVPPPVCIVVHANGAPAPASCTDPGSYQVTP
jgi:hypothetical protein